VYYVVTYCNATFDSFSKILKVCLFGRASLSGNHAPGPKTKARIWELQSTSPGMIAASAVLVSFSFLASSRLS
jgi:hypothetical protein